MSIEALLKAKKAQDNEFYTTKGTAELFINYCDNVVRNILKLKPGATIWLPADSDRSEITIVAKEKWQEYNVINTSDDYYTHEDIRDRADFICTNPPFTGMNKTIKYFSSRPFVIMCPNCITFDLNMRYISPHVFHKSKSEQYRSFVRANGKEVQIGIFYCTNIKEAYIRKENKTAKHPLPKKAQYFEPYINRVIERKDYFDIKDDEEYVTIPAAQIIFVDYDKYDIIMITKVPGCYNSMLLKKKTN